MDEDLEDFDFGDICDEHCHVPKECCKDEKISKPDDHVISNYVLIAHNGNKDACGYYRKFTVNLHRSGSWSFTYTNGKYLTQEEIQLYCKEISGAQSLLVTRKQWNLRGRGIGVWDFKYNSGAGSDGANQDNNTKYYPSGFMSNTENNGCSILGKADLNVRP